MASERGGETKVVVVVVETKLKREIEQHDTISEESRSA